jgi:hypothetical protein
MLLNISVFRNIWEENVAAKFIWRVGTWPSRTNRQMRASSYSSSSPIKWASLLGPIYSCFLGLTFSESFQWNRNDFYQLDYVRYISIKDFVRNLLFLLAGIALLIPRVIAMESLFGYYINSTASLYLLSSSASWNISADTFSSSSYVHWTVRLPYVVNCLHFRELCWVLSNWIAMRRICGGMFWEWQHSACQRWLEHRLVILHAEIWDIFR